MIGPRKGFWGTAAVVLAFLLYDRLAKPILDVEVQDFWKENVQGTFKERAWSGVATMLEWLGPFWGGVLSVLLVWFGYEMVLAWRRRRESGAPSLVMPPGEPKPPSSGKDWWVGRKWFQVFEAACLLTGTAPSEFATCEWSKSLAKDLLHDLDRGHTLLAIMENRLHQARGQVLSGRTLTEAGVTFSIDSYISAAEVLRFANRSGLKAPLGFNPKLK